MQGLFRWLIDGIQWLRGLAQPQNLQQLVNLGGPPWVGYAILFAIVFSETGLLVGFFLPGDSLLFTAGFLAGAQPPVFNLFWLNVVLMVAAVAGDAVNYALGRKMGEHVFEKNRIRFVKREHLLAAKMFYERHGNLSIVLARFVPLVRTFTPFVAGVARMSYWKFAYYNITGGVAWVLLMTMAGYWLGQIGWVQRNFEAVVLFIVVVSVLPVFIGAFNAWRANRKRPPTDGAIGTLPSTEPAVDP